MSRSGYTDDCDDNWSLIRWRGAVASALRGKRGQAFLREALAALDAMPVKELIANDLVRKPDPAFAVGDAPPMVCTLGAVGLARETPMEGVDPEDHDAVADLFCIPHALACEIMFMNDELHYKTPRERWERMRSWIVSNLKEPVA